MADSVMIDYHQQITVDGIPLQRVNLGKHLTEAKAVNWLGNETAELPPYIPAIKGPLGLITLQQEVKEGVIQVTNNSESKLYVVAQRYSGHPKKSFNRVSVQTAWLDKGSNAIYHGGLDPNSFLRVSAYEPVIPPPTDPNYQAIVDALAKQKSEGESSWNVWWRHFKTGLSDLGKSLGTVGTIILVLIVVGVVIFVVYKIYTNRPTIYAAGNKMKAMVWPTFGGGGPGGS